MAGAGLLLAVTLVALALSTQQAQVRTLAEARQTVAQSLTEVLLRGRKRSGGPVAARLMPSELARRRVSTVYFKECAARARLPERHQLWAGSSSYLENARLSTGAR